MGKPVVKGNSAKINFEGVITIELGKEKIFAKMAEINQ